MIWASLDIISSGSQSLTHMSSFQVELKHTVELLHEEQERIVKIEAIKKSLEVEVKVHNHKNCSIY